MKTIRDVEIEQRRRRQRTRINVLERVSFVVGLTLCTVLPSRAWTYYSGASVGSDGTVYGWGVTDVTSYTMHHVAYVTTTLTSPEGRIDGPVSASAQNSVRVDVALGFVPSDLGIYLVKSTNKGYCYACNCWILNSGSGASALDYSPTQHNYPSNPLPKPC